MKGRLSFLLIGFWLLANSQSFFSSRGLGEEILTFDAFTASLGKQPIFSWENPSFPLNLKNTITIGNIRQELLYAREEKEERLLYNLKINYAKLLIPSPFATHIGLSLREYFSQDFNIYSETVGAYYWHILGKGGINSLSFSLGKRFENLLSLGVSYNYIFGGSEENWSFETANQPLVQETIFGKYTGNSVKFATIGNISNCQLGAVLEIFLPLNYEGYLSVNKESVAKKKINLPPVYNLGASFLLSGYRQVFLGINYKNWQNLKLNGEVTENFADGFLISLGFSDYLKEKYPLRIGYAENFWYLISRGGKRVQESSLNFGTSIKIPKYGFFDINLEIFYRRGVRMKETGLKLFTTARFDEAWKKRTRRWGY